ncbi:hypothetical protein HG536_0F01180 [Torulaspora globosa]|uniref:Ribosome biogenesis protein ALB1 n=1 Tax=Torulaspora globosa TaxID=48254 RepID=A0A7G3ZJV7_9SACH|nr:uncharacterized protein HG536_0F01180 [Torulaspora globosa]QLL33793.1 hypothetical protein HG536_0F01180 [Torulaspora globosa]
MPSKNSINRPKLTTNLNRKTQSLARKRDQRERAGLLQPARSSEKSKSGQVKSVPLELYFHGKVGQTAGNQALTTKTLSKKRAKKIERNLKYAEQRKLLAELQDKVANEDGMEVDVQAGKSQKREEKKSSLAKMKDALWRVIDDSSSQGLVLNGGQGTTLGGPVFC